MDGEREILLEAHGLEVRRAGQPVVRDLELELRAGEVVALLGPNGAGKSTTLAVLAGTLPAAAGVLRAGGRALSPVHPGARRCIGYLPERVPLYPEMTARRHLLFCARLQGLRGAEGCRAAEAALERCDLEPLAHRRAERLSLGQRRRLGIAMAVVHEPPVVLLDEPTVGLDPRQVEGVRRLVRSLGRDGAVLLASHALGEVQQSCGRLLIMAGGRIVHEGPVDGGAGCGELVVRFSGMPAGAAPQGIEGVRIVRRLEGDRWHLRVADADAADRLLATALREGWSLQEWIPYPLALEQRFLAATGEGAA